MGRRLGQHFLRSDAILGRIAAAVCPQREPLVVEIGPGGGALTGYLLELAERVIAIEVDAEMVAKLTARFGTSYPGLEIVHGDVLKADLAQWGDAVVAGNLPYYITSPIIDHVLDAGSQIRRAVFLMQLEVAERLATGPGSRDYGYLSVSTQVRASVRKLFDVPRSAFAPPPKVDSAAVELTPLAAEPGIEEFLKFVGLCFTQKRKTLRNNLLAHYPGADDAAFSQRAEQLSIEELRALYRRLKSAG